MTYAFYDAKKYLARRDKVRRAFKKLKLEALYVSNPVNVRYLTGFTGGSAALLMQADLCHGRYLDVIISDPRFTLQIAEECPGLPSCIRERYDDPAATLRDLLGTTSGGHIGFEGDHMPVNQRDLLFDKLPFWRYASTKNLVEMSRQIKDKNEINAIQQAVNAAYKGFQKTVQSELHSPHLNEVSFRNRLEFECHSCGAEAMSFPSIVAAGSRSALPHAFPTNAIIAGKTHLLVDWGCVVDGYMSDLTRVVILKPRDKTLRKIYEVVLAANEAAIAAIQPGKTCAEIDGVARRLMADAGYGEQFSHALGHSVGLEIHENPRFSLTDETVLKPGMILTVEPGIYMKGWGGVRIEDDILVTRTGCKVLSKEVPKKFDEVIVEL